MIWCLTLIQFQTYYLVKWEGYPHSENTWEPASSFESASHMISLYNAKKKSKLFVPETPTNNNEPAEDKIEEWQALFESFSHGQEPDKIMNLKRALPTYEVMAIVKWKGKRNQSLVPRNVLQRACPELLIEFYENHITWKHKMAFK